MTKRRKISAVAAVATTLAGTSVVSAAQESGASADGNCVVPDDSALRERAGAAPTSGDGLFEPYAHERWLSDATDESLAKLHQSIYAAVGMHPSASLEERVAGGLIGMTTDHNTKQVVVVVDPNVVEVETAQRLLNNQQFDVLVQGGCFTARDLIAAGKRIIERRWHPRANSIEMAGWLDPRTSQIRVSFLEKDMEVGEALAREFGDIVKVEYSDAESFSRALFAGGDRENDTDPHWGGALLEGDHRDYYHGDVYAVNCSSGFAVEFGNGTVGSVTARHCFTASDNELVDSGSEFYGKTSVAPTQAMDMQRIRWNGTETYENVIHTDPGAPTNRVVTQAADPSLLVYTCLSGAVTRAVCGIQITSLDAMASYYEVDYKNLVFGEKPGSFVGQGGDSGSPIYRRVNTGGANNAKIRGIQTGGTADSNFFGHRVSEIETYIGDVVVS